MRNGPFGRDLFEPAEKLLLAVVAGEAGVQWVLPLVVVGAGIVLLVTSAFRRRR